MTVVYRAYSPSRDEGTVPVRSRQRATSTADSHNRIDAEHGQPCDWMVQAGHIEWEKP